MKITLTLVGHSAKSGVATYKANRLRANGAVYLTAKMFTGENPPQTLEIEGEGLAEPAQPAAPKAKKSDAPSGNEAGSVSDQPATEAVEVGAGE